MNAHYRTLAEYIIREITLQQNHSQTFMQKVRLFFSNGRSLRIYVII